MDQKRLCVLIPPSEGKLAGGVDPPLKRVKQPVREMVERLRKYDGDWNKLLGVKGAALEAAVKSNKNVLKSPTMPAIERYTGVVYQGIDYPSLNGPAKKHFNKHVRIVSALFGLVEPQAAIPDYKLKIDKLDAARYWKPPLAKSLGGCFVVDLLPQAHRKAVSYRHGIEIEFFVENDGRKKSSGHFGKLIKGRFVRWLCENRIVSSDRFHEFDEDGYRWDGSVFMKQE